jgi:hypothetical protein
LKIAAPIPELAPVKTATFPFHLSTIFEDFFEDFLRFSQEEQKLKLKMEMKRF